jgi:hypothetical protein
MFNATFNNISVISWRYCHKEKSVIFIIRLKYVPRVWKMARSLYVKDHVWQFLIRNSLVGVVVDGPLEG